MLRTVVEGWDMATGENSVISLADAAVGSISKVLRIVAAGCEPHLVSVPCHKRTEYHSGVRAGFPGQGDVLAYQCDFEWWLRVFEFGDLPLRNERLAPHDVMWAAAVMLSVAGTKPVDVAMVIAEQLPEGQ